MSSSRPHILLVSPRGSPNLLGSYGRALERIGTEVSYWDIEPAIRNVVRLGVVGRTLHSHLHLETWMRQSGRALILEARARQPDAIFVGGMTPVSAGALAQIKASVPQARLVLMWPDMLLNLGPHTLAALPLYDLVATYSDSSIVALNRLGARNLRWVPFAADPELFPANISLSETQRRELTCDVSFVGNHRPERERAVVALLDAGIDVKVWGEKNWVQRSADPKRARSYWQGRPLVGDDFARAVKASKVCLNVVDDTNYPSANMRFFESLACRACSLVSATPEMFHWFPDGVAASYFDGELGMIEKARALLADPGLRSRLAEEGHKRVMAGHTYVHRARQIMESLESPLP